MRRGAWLGRLMVPQYKGCMLTAPGNLITYKVYKVTWIKTQAFYSTYTVKLFQILDILLKHFFTLFFFNSVNLLRKIEEKNVFFI